MAATSTTNEQRLPFARSKLLAEDAGCEGLEEGFAEGTQASPSPEASWRLKCTAPHRLGAVCAAIVLGAVVVLRGTGAPPRLAASRESSPKSILAEVDDDC